MSVKINENVANSLQITIPAKGQTNWSDDVRKAFQKIGDHNHTGGGNGSQITTEAIATGAVTDAKLATDVILDSLHNVQDTTTPTTGQVLTWIGSYWAPSAVSATVGTIKIVENQANINALSLAPGDIVAVKNPQGTGYTANDLTGNSTQLADFSSLTLDGIQIVTANGITVKLGANKRCVVKSDQGIEIVGASETSFFAGTFLKLGGTSGLDTCSADIKGNLQSDGSGTMSIDSSFIRCSKLELSNSNLSISTDTQITASEGIALLISNGLSFGGTTSEPLEIISKSIRRKLPSTATTNDILHYDGVKWAAQSYYEQGQIAQVNLNTAGISSQGIYSGFESVNNTFLTGNAQNVESHFSKGLTISSSQTNLDTFDYYAGIDVTSTGIYEIEIRFEDTVIPNITQPANQFFLAIVNVGPSTMDMTQTHTKYYDKIKGTEITPSTTLNGEPISNFLVLARTENSIRVGIDGISQIYRQFLKIETAGKILPLVKGVQITNGQNIDFENVIMTLKKISDL